MTQIDGEATSNARSIVELARARARIAELEERLETLRRSTPEVADDGAPLGGLPERLDDEPETGQHASREGQSRLALAMDRAHVFDAVREGIWTLDLDGKTDFVNYHGASLLGYLPEEMLGRPQSDFVSPDDARAGEEAVDPNGRPGSASRTRRMRHKSGHDVWIEARDAPISGAGGRAVVGMLSLFADVTDRKRAEDELRRSERALRASQRVAHLGNWAWDVRTNHLEWSEEMFRIFGLEPEGFTGDLATVIAAAIHPDDREAVERSNRSVVEDGRPIPLEYRVIRPDGTIRIVWAEAGELLRDAEGRPTTLTGIVQDVTERRRAEEAFRESEQRTRTLVQWMPDATIVHRAGTILFVNRAAVRLFGGRSVDDLMGKPVLELVDPAVRDVVSTRMRAAAESGLSAAAMEQRILRLDGTVLDVEVQGTPIPYAGGTALLAVIHDITDRKLAERTLRESEERYRNIVENISDALIIHDFDGDILDANDFACRFFGYSREAFIGRNLSLISAPERTGLEAALMRGLREGREVRFEGLSVRRDGTRLPTEVVARPVSIVGRGLVHGFVRDITDRKRAEEDRSKLEAQLQQARKMESVGRLAGGVAHDFNNMLGVILGHAELALEGVDPSAPLHDDLEEIRKAANRSADLTRQLLAFARKQTVAPKVLDLNATVAGMLKMLRRLIGEHIDLKWTPDPALWPVRMDPSQVDQILANLCVNARDAIDTVGRVTIDTANVTLDEHACARRPGLEPGDYVQLVVSDDGCGMDAETAALVFEPFFTTKGVGKGTGLGLATVYGIVRQNDGFIRVDSAPNEGTTFAIYLPRHDATVEAARGPEAAAPSYAGHETILVVEDEAAVLKLTKRILGKLGYTVLTASTPSEALRQAREHDGRLDLLLTDVLMPEMNGRDLVTRLSTLRPGLRRIYMSGYTADVVSEHEGAEGAPNFLQKPFSRESLAAKVRAVLDAEPPNGAR